MTHHPRRRRSAGQGNCPNCRADRWRTVVKGEQWRCRRCGYVRTDPGEQRAAGAEGSAAA